MNRECKKHRKNLVAYMDRELPRKRLIQIDEHLQGCALCQKELEELRMPVAALLEWESIVPSAGYDRVFWEKVEGLKAGQKNRKEKSFSKQFRLCFKPKFALVTSAALAALIFLITFFELKPLNNEPSQSEILFVQDFDLLYNLEIIENREALENFEVINFLDILEQEVNG